jgi:hypothetical protein
MIVMPSVFDKLSVEAWLALLVEEGAGACLQESWKRTAMNMVLVIEVFFK